MSQDSLGNSSYQFHPPSLSQDQKIETSPQNRQNFKGRRMSTHDVRSHAREIHDSRARDSRSSLLDKFRNISLSAGDADEGVGNDSGLIEEQMNDDVFNNQEETDDWGDPTKDKPSVDLRQFNFQLPGILCPYCRANMMLTMDQKEKIVLKPGLGNVVEVIASHKCPCGFEIQVDKTSDQIKQNIKNVLVHHEAICLSNQSPHYTLFSSNIVLSCTVCNLAQIVS